MSQAPNEKRETALYRCPGCDKVVRYGTGARGLGCLCDALPLGSDAGKFDRRFGEIGGQIGPPRPYFHDREHTMVEFDDDGREGVDDLREGLWLA